MGPYESEPTLVEWLAAQSRFTRVSVGLLASAVIACYLPHLIVAATGKWINNLTMWGVMAVYVLVLIVQNLTGVALRRRMAAAVVWAAIWLVYFTIHIVRTKFLKDWSQWWMVLFVPPTGSLLNGWLMEIYGRAVGLWEAPRRGTAAPL